MGWAARRRARARGAARRLRRGRRHRPAPPRGLRRQPARAAARRALRARRSATPRTSRRSNPAPCSSRPPTTTCSSSLPARLGLAGGSVALSVDAPEHFSRPSIDVLFGSAADAYGDRAAGVVLTGANADGADGLARIARRGGPAIVQDPETAMRREMPDAALAATPRRAASSRWSEIGGCCASWRARARGRSREGRRGPARRRPRGEPARARGGARADGLPARERALGRRGAARAAEGRLRGDPARRPDAGPGRL